MKQSGDQAASLRPTKAPWRRTRSFFTFRVERIRSPGGRRKSQRRPRQVSASCFLLFRCPHVSHLATYYVEFVNRHSFFGPKLVHFLRYLLALSISLFSQFLVSALLFQSGKEYVNAHINQNTMFACINAFLKLWTWGVYWTAYYFPQLLNYDWMCCKATMWYRCGMDDLADMAQSVP